MARLSLTSLVLLLGCGAGTDLRTSDMVEITTYLATPARGSATDDAAARDCRRRGKRALYRATRGDGRGGFRHIYECLR